MNLLYKEDWDRAKDYYRAWWNHEETERCLLWVTAPKAGTIRQKIPLPATPEEYWTDLDYIATRLESEHASTFFGGEAFPRWSAGYPGHKNIAAFLGCRVTLDFKTGWLDPILTGSDLDIRRLVLDEKNGRFQYALKEQARAVKEARGKSIPAICGALGACADSLAWVRGTERLLIDVLDRPEQVLEADLHLMDIWIRVYERFFRMAQEGAEGSCPWLAVWAPGKCYPVQNDFAYMIATDQFRRLFLPALEKQLRYLDQAVYHLDGEGNFRHLDMLLELPAIRAFQIVPSPQNSPLQFLPMLKKIQAAGRSLHFNLKPEEIEPALGELSSRGLMICTKCRTEAEARQLLKNAERWSHS